jgi:hypothetical protein
MNPLLSNMVADYSHHERLAAAGRESARNRQLRWWRTPDPVAPVGVTLTGSANGVRRPHWWAAIEAGETVAAGDTARD